MMEGISRDASAAEEDVTNLSDKAGALAGHRWEP